MVLGVAKQHYTWELIEASGRFALHLLYPHQIELVERFGTVSGRETDKYDDLDAGVTPGACPLILKTLAWLDCRVEERLDTGDRTVYLAAVEAGGTNGDVPPLTVGRLFTDMQEELREHLHRLYVRDGNIDRDAIVSWRLRQDSG
jgi:flavin reductase (DIM6/NTAB) family NADH-FMN oxidoreductase RutF